MITARVTTSCTPAGDPNRPRTTRTSARSAPSCSVPKGTPCRGTSTLRRGEMAGWPSRVVDQYGTHDFGRHCLMARRLLEGGATFVKVTHTNYDTHHENFDFHIEQLGEFDRSFATLLEDLQQRGLLDSTLVIVMSEF